jgi:hypothetical protein
MLLRVATHEATLNVKGEKSVFPGKRKGNEKVFLLNIHITLLCSMRLVKNRLSASSSQDCPNRGKKNLYYNKYGTLWNGVVPILPVSSHTDI